MQNSPIFSSQMSQFLLWLLNFILCLEKYSLCWYYNKTISCFLRYFIVSFFHVNLWPICNLFWTRQGFYFIPRQLPKHVSIYGICLLTREKYRPFQKLIYKKKTCYLSLCETGVGTKNTDPCEGFMYTCYPHEQADRYLLQVINSNTFLSSTFPADIIWLDSCHCNCNRSNLRRKVLQDFYIYFYLYT